MLAYSWIYGDTVHADEEAIARGSAFDVDDRFRAAVPLIARIMGNAIATLGLIAHFFRRGAIPLDPAVFTKQVLAAAQPVRRRAVLRVAPEGTPVDFSRPIIEWGEDWTTLVSPKSAEPQQD